MPTVGGELRRVLVLAMGSADSARLAGDLSDWVRDGGESALSVLAARAVATAGAGSSLDVGILAHSAAGDPSLNPFLTASLAAIGDFEARAALLSDLSDEDLLVRTRALEAAAMSGLEELLLDLVTDDPSVTLRVLASEAVAKLLPDGRAQSALKQGLRDQSPVVRQACMRGLLLAGDPEVAGVFIEALRSDLSELGPVFRAVRGCWDSHPRLADQAAEVLITRLEGMSSRAISEREPWLQALGQVPSTLGSSWLIELASRTDGEVHNMPVHRWLFLQVSNGGPQCRASLVDAFYKETSIERRFDLLWAASFSAEEDARAFLMDVVLRDDCLDHERLYAADRLTKLGPTSVIAPILKRACVRIKDAKVRPAFESLLWTWYG
ncbi:MAG: hypothetical protein OSB14_10170, partial [Planctomycetota bacterium]|nr:hypothetical protein [Planctomycetota bacterium]